MYLNRIFPFLRSGNMPNVPELTWKWSTTSASVVSHGKWTWRSLWTSTRTKGISTISHCSAAVFRSVKRTQCMFFGTFR